MTEQPEYDIPGHTGDPIDGLINIVEPDSSEPEQAAAPEPEPVKPRRKPVVKTKPAKTVYKPFHW